MTTPAIIRQRRDTAANWAAENPVLHDGQMGFETDTGLFKLGNGSDAWNDLPYPSGQIVLALACSNLTDDIEPLDPAAYIVAPRDFKLTWVRASLLEPSSAGDVEIDIANGGTTVLDVALTIDEGDTDSDGATVPVEIDATAEDISNGDVLTVEIVDGGADAKGLIVYLYGYVA